MTVHIACLRNHHFKKVSDAVLEDDSTKQMQTLTFRIKSLCQPALCGSAVHAIAEHNLKI